MKRKALLTLSSLSLLLLACGGEPAPSSSSSASSADSSKEESSSTTPTSSSEQSSSSSEASSSSASSSASSTSKPPSKDGTYDFYCINDFHGSIVEQGSGSYYEAGIAKYFGKLKALKAADPEHNIILSAGDMFQGSLESNSNYGKLIMEAMNETGFDAMTVGNHEFDYGQQKLLDNVNRANFPVLGGNIVKHDTDTPWNQAIKTSTILQRGGNKIGVVGMIGYGQTTSISSPYVQDIDFKNPTPLAKAEAKRLREEEGCNLVIYVIHDDMNTCYTGIADKAYFDGVFCGHKHTLNDEVVFGVPFVQSYCNGEAISHFKITITDGTAVCTEHGIIQSDSAWEEDPEIAAIRDSYIEDPAFKAKAARVAGTVDGTLYAKEGVSNLGVKAIYEKYHALHPEIVCAIENGQRANLRGTITYHDIYKATPFMNKIVIAKVKGSEIWKQASYSGMSCYHGNNQINNSNDLYTVACIDYVLYHQNESKIYNYFSSLNTNFDSKIVADYEDFPFDITFDYVKNNLGGTVTASDFLNSSSGFGPI